MTHYSLFVTYSFVAGFVNLGTIRFPARTEIRMRRMTVSAFLDATAAPSNPDQFLEAIVFLARPGAPQAIAGILDYAPAGTAVIQRNSGTPIASSKVPFEGCVSLEGGTQEYLLFGQAFPVYPNPALTVGDTIQLAIELTIDP